MVSVKQQQTIERSDTQRLNWSEGRLRSAWTTRVKLNEKKSRSTNHVGCHRFVCSSRKRLCWWEGVPWKEKDGCGGAWVCERENGGDLLLFVFLDEK